MIFLTGGNGFLGTSLIEKFFEFRPDLKICVLVRGKTEIESQLKLDDSCKKIIKKFGEQFYRDRIKVVKGDLSKENLGLSHYDKDFLCGNISSIYNNAANTNLGAPFAELAETNIIGTEKVLGLAKDVVKKNSDLRFFHISTAYVAGDQAGIQTPNELNLEVRFRNAYEQTKAIAETKVRACKDDFNVTTYRPSIIVGDSRTGFTSAFNVLYIPARIIISGLLKAVPALPHAPFDVVPVDYVSESIVKSHATPVVSGSTYYLSAGVGRETSPIEILELLFSTANLFGNKHLHNLPSFIPPEKVHKALGSVSSLAHHVYQSSAFKNFEKLVCEKLPVFRQLTPLIPYMISNPRFNNSETLNTFSNSIAEAPLFINYGENIFKYCFQTDWGKRSSSLA